MSYNLNGGIGGNVLPFGTGLLQREISLQYSYIVTVANTNLPVTLNEVRSQLKFELDDTSQDTYLTSLIFAAKAACESYTSRTTLTTTYITYRNGFNQQYFLFKKSPFIALLMFQYLRNDNTWVDVDPTLYYTTVDTIYSKVVLNYNKSWPSDIMPRLQSIRMTFTAGYGATDTNIPQELQQGMLQHICYLYANRGDGSNESDYAELPGSTKLIYKNFQIRSIVAEVS